MGACLRGDWVRGKGSDFEEEGEFDDENEDWGGGVFGARIFRHGRLPRRKYISMYARDSRSSRRDDSAKASMSNVPANDRQEYAPTPRWVFIAANSEVPTPWKPSCLYGMCAEVFESRNFLARPKSMTLTIWAAFPIPMTKFAGLISRCTSE